MHRRNFLKWTSLTGLQLTLPSCAGFVHSEPETGQTGLLLDPYFLKHSMGPFHPETPERLKVVEARLKSADIFEALTASDRPYKTAKKLSEAIHILNDFKEKKEV